MERFINEGNKLIITILYFTVDPLLKEHGIYKRLKLNFNLNLIYLPLSMI